ncbi:hypothetical protein DL96DRAFT_525303 [Flagelloscypha sp. PMI_526]|nr:hypothetical protein DL96DRAFT_525303 [Flagelloscypha sp. PMI_526]
MKKFKPELPKLQHVILSLQWSDKSKCSNVQCMSPPSSCLFRCQEGCFGRPLMCKTCILSSHHQLPFHPIEERVSRFFKPSALADLGFVLHLGHDGSPCDNTEELPRTFVIGHTNRLHTIPVRFCGCHGAEADHIQLTAAGLFPATVSRPESAFTFELLDTFEAHSLVSGLSAHHYFQSLRQRTNPTFPHKAPDRVREFLRVTRVWTELASRRRSGQDPLFEIDRFLPQCFPRHSRCIVCPTCPLVGFNITREEMYSLKEDEAHKAQLVLSGDGNYGLHLNANRGDPDDFELNDGHAFMVETDAFEAAMKALGLQIPTLSTCARLTALKGQNLMRFLNCIISGVFAVQCARHGFFMPHGVVDLELGEKFICVDYALANVLEMYKDCRWICFVYDIVCQYIVNVAERFEKSHPRVLEAINKVQGLIPKLHILGHIAKCIHTLSLSYTPSSGRTYGEMIESTWHMTNKAGASTAEMNHGHRHEKLDVLFQHINRTKMLTWVYDAMRKYVAAVHTVQKRQKSFNDLCEVHGATLVEAWLAMDELPKVTGTGKSDFESPFKVNLDSTKFANLQGESAVLKELEDVVENSHTLDDGPTSISTIVDAALKVETEQLHTLKLLGLRQRDSNQEQEVENLRCRIEADLQRLRTLQSDRFPHLRSLIQEDQTAGPFPEKAKLFLPSDTGLELWAIRNGHSLVPQVELKLRQGQAHDALQSLRESIIEFLYMVKARRLNPTSTKQATRSQQFLTSLAAEKYSAFDKYNFVRKRMLVLGLKPEDPIFRPLLTSECWMKDPTEERELGDGSTPDPWFWNIGKGMTALTAETKSDFLLECQRVQWFRDRAELQRWKEEIEILEAEFPRTARAHEEMAIYWINVAENTLHKGGQVYAYKKARMFEELQKSVVDGYAAAQLDAQKNPRERIVKPPKNNSLAKYNQTQATIAQIQAQNEGGSESEDEEMYG